MWYGVCGITLFLQFVGNSLDMPKELEKQGLLDRQIWYVAWGLWDNLVSLIRWEFVGFAQGTRETRFVE